jgi:hypothetical protein
MRNGLEIGSIVAILSDDYELVEGVVIGFSKAYTLVQQDNGHKTWFQSRFLSSIR